MLVAHCLAFAVIVACCCVLPSQEAAKFSAQSKMGIDNLAMVFAPNVLRSRSETLQQIMEDTNYIKIILRSLIEVCDRL
jgi:hypothetical protein